MTLGAMLNWLRSDRYKEMMEENAPVVLTPLRPTSMLQPSHFSTPLPQLKYPVRLDFSHERFRLRSLAPLSQVKWACVSVGLARASPARVLRRQEVGMCVSGSSACFACTCSSQACRMHVCKSAVLRRHVLRLPS